MSKDRLQAFSDAVIAIIITIMVLELEVPHEATLESLLSTLPVFVTYILSFILIAIYWNNHHHMLHATERVNGAILWANMHLLFWLSLIPFVTAWMGVNEFSNMPVALYGAVQLFAAIAYYLLAHALAAHHEKDSPIGRAIGNDRKGKISIAMYALSVPMAFYYNWLALALIIIVAAMWFIPDRRMSDELD